MARENHRYRKISTEVEAYQWTKNSPSSRDQWPRWLKDGFRLPYLTQGSFRYISGSLYFTPKDGFTERVPDDTWIVREGHGHPYLIGRNTFLKLYEKIIA